MVMRQLHPEQTEESAPKRERLEARVSAEQKEVLQRAAALHGQSLSDFVISRAFQAAQEAIREHDIITLTARDSQLFVETLLNPPAPGAKLRAAAARYSREILGR